MAEEFMPSGWIETENRFLQILMQMQSKWALALQAAHKCERNYKKNPRECVGDLDNALEEALELEKLLVKYIEVLNTMKALVQRE